MALCISVMLVVGYQYGFWPSFNLSGSRVFKTEGEYFWINISAATCLQFDLWYLPFLMCSYVICMKMIPSLISLSVA